MSRLNFKLQAQASQSCARACSFTTLHGEVQTPIFMPVGTQATVKGQNVESLKAAGSRVLLANTYHLLLRPGIEVFKKLGGIHRFMNWDGPVLTDSGGFQIFSLPHSRQIDEVGAKFQSYVDGRTYLLSPEESIGMQKAIGSDIMMVLDQCIPSTAGHAEAKTAMNLTHRWARRSLEARGESPQALFGIVQGACFHDLRAQSAEFLAALPFDGFAIGGLAVGESRAEREEFTEATAALLPKSLPRYLMGVGTPIDILEAVHRGVDLFDCILPSSLAQRGVAFTSLGKLQLRRGVYKFSEERLDPACGCPACIGYSRAYLHHLVKCEELLGWQLLASHNLAFYHRMMREIRESIIKDTFFEYYQGKRTALLRSDEENPVQKPASVKKKSERALRLGDYEVHGSLKGFSSIRQVSSGEVMHAVSKPSEEAAVLYIEQSRLEALLLEAGSDVDDPLVIWDVGLGAASNAMAAVQCFEKAFAEQCGNIRPLKIISFENDMDSLRLALKHPSRFPHLRHGAPHRLLEKGEWTHSKGPLRWELFLGDFEAMYESATAPDLIFYDLFSLKSETQHWTPARFSGILQKCLGRPSALYTYSTSTAVRAALLSAGFFVARGVATGPKLETTVAFTDPEAAMKQRSLLGPEWLGRWQRSGAKYPGGVSLEAQPEFEAGILAHPQFSPKGGRIGVSCGV